MAGLWLLQDLRMRNLAATSGRGWADGGNIKASYCPKALEQFQSWRKTPFSSVLHSLVIFPMRLLCACESVCLFAAYSFQALMRKKWAGNLPQSIALFEHRKSLVCSMKNAQLSFIDRKEWTNSVAVLCHYINKCLPFSIAIAAYHFLVRSEQFSSPRWSAF